MREVAPTTGRIKPADKKARRDVFGFMNKPRLEGLRMINLPRGFSMRRTSHIAQKQQRPPRRAAVAVSLPRVGLALVLAPVKQIAKGRGRAGDGLLVRSEEHTSELQSRQYL